MNEVEPNVNKSSLTPDTLILKVIYMIGIRKISGFFLVLSLVLVNLSYALPPEIEADRLGLIAQDHMKKGEFAKAITTFDKIHELNIELPGPYYFFYGFALNKTGEFESSTKLIYKYLEITERGGENYATALQVLTANEESRIFLTDEEQAVKQEVAMLEKEKAEEDKNLLFEQTADLEAKYKYWDDQYNQLDGRSDEISRKLKRCNEEVTAYTEKWADAKVDSMTGFNRSVSWSDCEECGRMREKCSDDSDAEYAQYKKDRAKYSAEREKVSSQLQSLKNKQNSADRVQTTGQNSVSERNNEVGDKSGVNSFSFNPRRFSLENDLVLLVNEDPAAETVAIRAIFPGGLSSETEASNGAFAFISNLLPKGTTELSSQELSLKIANMGGAITGFNGRNTFGLSAEFPVRSFRPGLLLVHDIIRNPAFDNQETEEIRSKLLLAYNKEENSLPHIAFFNFQRVLFQGHPYSLRTDGSEEGIKDLTVNQLRAIYFHHARPDQMVLSISGAVKSGEVLNFVKSLFADWEPGKKVTKPTIFEKKLIPINEPPSKPIIINISKESSQAHTVIGFLGATIYNPESYGLLVLDALMSDHNGPLYSELHYKSSLSDSLSAFCLTGIDTGSFGIYIGTSLEKKDAAVQMAWGVLERIRHDLVSDRALDRAKKIIIDKYVMHLKTLEGIALEMGLSETYGQGMDHPNRFVKLIEGITSQEVLAVAKKYITPNNYIAVTVGANQQVEHAERSMPGDFTVLP